MFEGDYARIELHHCKRALLRNVRTRALWIERSQVELKHVEILASDVGAVIDRSRVRWTGGHIAAATCMDTNHSELGLLAVSCAFCA